MGCSDPGYTWVARKPPSPSCPLISPVALLRFLVPTSHTWGLLEQLSHHQRLHGSCQHGRAQGRAWEVASPGSPAQSPAICKFFVQHPSPGKGWGDGPCNWGLRGLSLGASEGCWWGRGQGLLILLGLGVKPDAQVFYQGQETTAFYFNSSFLERSERVRERQIFHPLVHNADGGCDGWRRTSSKLEPSSGSPVSGQGLSSTAFPGT